MGANAELVGLMGPQLDVLLPVLDEKSRRLVLGAVARAAGDGGIGAVAKATGASWQTVAGGAAELGSGDAVPPGRVRRPGGGRRRLTEADPGLLPALEALIKDAMRGDPESPLVWTTRSAEHLARQLTAQGHRCSDSTVLRMLARAGFTQQSNARAQEGRRHPERDAQFRYIAAQVKEHQDAGQPVISVDAKKKEKVGNYAHDGREWGPAGEPVAVRSHDFPDKDQEHAIPYGIWDEQANAGFVNVGTDGNTAALAVESIRRWWALAGKDAYPGATRLLVTCDAGGSNGYRNGHWKAGLARLAAETGLEITVCHFPPGTSKWNAIEHRLFCQITLAWRGRPLTSYDIIINTIGAVTTRTGLTATAVLDRNEYPAGTQLSGEQIKDIEDRWLARHAFHGEWNYALLPAPRPDPAAEPQPPAPAGPDLHALASPAITGLPREDLAALAASLQVPLAAAREQRLYTSRGRPRRIGNHRVPRTRLTPQARVLAAVYRYRLGMTGRAIAALLGIDTSVISIATRQIAALAGTATGPLAAGPVRLRTLDDLHEHAARHHITITGPPQAADTPPDDTLTTPDTP
ncbi:MAG TPA: ISAzo13 family transposase [Streptosporangiaceae bacterium]|nr:ISAzo13 family transposase [Streptosporangiaceae bacterium]